MLRQKTTKHKTIKQQTKNNKKKQHSKKLSNKVNSTVNQIISYDQTFQPGHIATMRFQKENL